MFKSSSKFYKSNKVDESNIYDNFSRMFRLDETQQMNMSRMMNESINLQQSFMFMFPDVKIEDIQDDQQKYSENQSDIQNSQKFIQNHSNIRREFNRIMD